ncbi:MAG: hypothetical protein ABI355_13270 [Solirubrobacteraceae bacterium]
MTALVIGLLVGVMMPTSAVARRSAPTGIHTEITAAAHAVSKISRSRFVRGQRPPLLSAVRAAQRLSGRRRPPLCRTAAAADEAISRLGLSSTWRQGRVPRSVRTPLRLLNRAESALLRRAGRRCAAPQRQTVRIAPQQGGSGFTPLPPPPQGPEQGGAPPIPLGPFHPPKSIGGSAGLGADLHARAPAARHGRPSANLAADPLAFFRSADVGVPPRTASPQEPTTAEGGGVAWFTGNTSDALSTDAGRTFTTLNPSTILPDSGLPFCCDQLVSYSPQANLFVWVMQYWCGPGSTSPATNDCRTAGTSSNRIRIAVASPQALIAKAASPGGAWTYWDLTPQTFGQPAGAWFDRSDLGVNIWNMNWTVDVLRGASGVSSILARVSLSDLARRGSISISYITDANARMTVAQGLGTTTTYYVGTNSLSQQRIWSYAAFAGSMFRHDVNHASVPNINSAANGTNANDWYDRYGIFPGAIESATISGNTLFTAQGTGRSYCTAQCGTPTPTLVNQFSQPSIFISRYDVNQWTDVGERWIWNPTLAFAWPALQTDGAGDVGLAFRSAAAGQNAQPVAGFLTPAEQFVFAEPAGAPHETGDYYSLRPGRTPQSFVMPAQTVQTDSRGNPSMHWQYIEYGHGPSPYVAPPNVHLTAPANLSAFTQGATVSYGASVSDPVDGTLPSAAIVWREDGVLIGTGSAIIHLENTAGVHVIQVTATNGDGKSASDSINIRVNAPPSALKVTITTPADGSAFGPGTFDQQLQQYCEDVPFTATVSGGQGTLSYSWTDVRTQDANPPAPSQQVSTQLSPTLHLCGGSGFNSSSTHDLTLTVTDGVNTATAGLRVTVFDPKLN